MELQTKIRQREAELRRRMSVLASAETDNADQQPAMGPLTMGAEQQGSEEPSPESDTSSSEPQTQQRTGKVRVKSPDGRIGMIPAAQLTDALAMGYQEIK